jgi:hypothetical protein
LRKLFLAPFGAYDATERLLKATLETGVKPAEILYLCPSPRKQRLVQVQFFRLVNQPAIVPPQFKTLSQLARDLHEQFGTARRFTPELKPLLVQRLLARETPNSKPQTPKRKPAPLSPLPSIGYARAVGDFITEIKRYVPRSDQAGLASRFKELLAAYEKPLARALEALDALELYNHELSSRNWADDEDIMAEAAHLVKAGSGTQSQFPGGIGLCPSRPRVLVLDSFVAPNRLEADLLIALIAQAETCLALGYAGDPKDEDYRLASKFVELVRGQEGFAVEALPASPAPPEPQLFAFPTIEDEVAGICRDILCRGTDINLPDTVVAFPKLADYAAMVKRIFEQYELPVTVYPATDLAASPPVLAVLELLRALDSDYERIATAAALGSPFLPGLLKLKAESDSENRYRAAAELNHYSRRARIIKGRVNWNNIATRLEAAEDRLEDTELEFAKDLQKRIRQATGLVDKMLEPADTIGNQARRLKQFLEAVDYCRNLKAEEPGTDELLEDRSELYNILDSLSGFEADFGARKQSRAQFIKTLVYLIRLAARAPEPAPAGVIVMDMTETLGLAPKRLYFGGLTETNLPGGYSGDPILPDRVRRELGMPDIDWHRDWQRFNFCRTMRASPNTPFLSFYDSDEGRPVLPSPFLTIAPLKPESSGIMYSEAEEQTAQGRSAGIRFADTCRPVDFGRDKDVLKVLAARFGPERPISVTRLEAYRTCPYLFYLENILGLETPEEPRYDIDTRQWGLVVHRVMEKLYAGGSLPVEQVHDAAMKALDATLAEVELPVFWQEVTRRVFANLLPDLVRCEAELREDGFQPQKTELSLAGNLTKDIAVRGRFDRVDASATAFRVLDYKTGRPGNFTPKAVIDGTHVQLPLYAWLYHEAKPGLAIDNFGVYSLREPDVIWFARRKYTVDELVKAALENAVAIVKSIRKGEFPALPADDRVCEYCNLGHTCGFSETGKDR